MKFKNLKKPIAILMTLALIIGVFSISFVASAEGNFYYGEEVTIGSETAMNIDNWNVIEGPTSVREITDTKIHLKAELDANGGVLVDRIQAKTPANARITAVNFTVKTQAKSKNYPLEFIYDYNGLSDYKALGLVGNSTASNTIYRRNQSSGTNQGDIVVSSTSWDEGSAHGSNWRNTFKVNFKYNYAADGTITAIISIVKTSGSGQVATLTNFNIGEVSNPCVILSGGSKTKTSTAAMNYNTETDYGNYSDISYAYQPAIDMTQDVTNFKSNYPISAIADITKDNAADCGKAASKAIQAHSELTNEHLKAALAGYIADCEAVLARAEVFLNGTYKLDFSSKEAAEQFATTKTYAAHGGRDVTSSSAVIGNVAYTYNNGIMTVDSNGTFDSLWGVNANAWNSPTGSKIQQVTGKIAMTGGGTWAALRVYFTGTEETDNKSALNISYGAASGYLTGAYLRAIKNHTGNADLANNKALSNGDAIMNTYNGAEVTAVAAPDVADVSTYLTFKIIISNLGRPTILLYAPNSNTPFVGYSLEECGTSGYSYNDWTQIGFATTRDMTVYLADVEISYVERETVVVDGDAHTFALTGGKAALTKPTMDGASIAVTNEVGNQDLRFQASYDPEATIIDGFKAVEYGMLVMPSAKMPSTNELNMAAVGKEGLGVIVGKKTLADGEALPATYYLELNGSGTLSAFNATIETIVGKRFVARAYVAYQDTVTGHIYYVYSDNENEKGTDAGQAAKSVIGVAKAIAENAIANGATDDGTISGIITQTTTTTALQREQLLTFIYNNKDKVVA